jgi:nucleoside-diphosphate-sugar epimerase
VRRPWLVTGATGRIGSLLVQDLIGQGRRVRALCLPGDDRAVALERVGVEVVVGELADPVAVGDAVAGVAGVYHLGAALTTRGAEASAIVRSIAVGTQTVLEAIRQGGMSSVPFLLVSSTSVYYDLRLPAPARFVTEYAPVRPSTPYGAAKHAAELITRVASLEGLVEGVIVRPADTSTPDELTEVNGVFGRRWFVSGALEWHRNQPEGTFGRLDDDAYSQLAATRSTLYVLRDEHGHEARIQIGRREGTVASALVRAMDMRTVAGEPTDQRISWQARVWPDSIRRRAELRIAFVCSHDEIVTVAECGGVSASGSSGPFEEGRPEGGDAVSNAESDLIY